jgi:hypothetical protein
MSKTKAGCSPLTPRRIPKLRTASGLSARGARCGTQLCECGRNFLVAIKTDRCSLVGGRMLAE